jgi:23S rRNA (guanine745-N1)-methyltransferase
MVRARVDFLSRGYYAEISRRFAELLSDILPERDSYVICDMGAGEGYHTCQIADTVHGKLNKDVLALGFDASKYAAECASKRSRSLGFMPRGGIGEAHDSGCAAYFMPGNIFSLPLADSSVDAAVSMFAPIAGEEAARLLGRGGILAVVAFGRDHLIEMRKVIYDDVHLSEAATPIPEGFREISRSSLTYKVKIESTEDIKSLFMMTPFYYKTSERGRDALFALSELEVTVDVNYSFFEVI